jgi:putative FmdB family regulatory protein
MPTYEYQCPDGHTFDVFQKMSDVPQATCAVCGLPATRKISGGAGLVFKGSGFYITDYGKDGKGPRKAPSEGGEKTSDKGAAADKGAGDKAAKPAAESKPSGEGRSARGDKPAAPAPAPKDKKDGA